MYPEKDAFSVQVEQHCWGIWKTERRYRLTVVVSRTRIFRRFGKHEQVLQIKGLQLSI